MLKQIQNKVMKKRRNVIYIVIITILLIIIVFQVFEKKQDEDNNKPIKTEFLDILISNVTDSIINYKTNISDNNSDIDQAKRLHNLTESCIKKEQKDSINMYIKIINKHIAKTTINQSISINDLKSTNEESRIYTYKFFEYLALSAIFSNMKDWYYKYDSYTIGIISNASFKNNRLKVGEDYEAAIVLIPFNFWKPGKIKIEGENKEYTTENGAIKYVRHSTNKGEKEVKGIYRFINEGKEYSVDFKTKYIVE